MAVVQTVCELIRAGFILVKRVLQKEKIGSERGATACCGAHQCEWQAQNLLLFAHEKQRVVWPEVRAVNQSSLSSLDLKFQQRIEDLCDVRAE